MAKTRDPTVIEDAAVGITDESSKKSFKQKKKKKSKSDSISASDSGKMALKEQRMKSKSPGSLSKKKKSKDGLNDPLNASLNALSLGSVDSKRSMGSPHASEVKLYTLSHEDYERYSLGYFQAVLEEIRLKCQRKLKLKLKDQEAFAMTCQNFYDVWTQKEENDRWLAELLDGNNPKHNPKEKRTTQELIEAQTKYAKELTATVLKRKNWCIKSALTVFMGLKEDSLMGLEDKLVKGAIIAQATPRKLAEFASKGKKNEKLLKALFSDSLLMKDMLLHGGAASYEYGEAIRIYVDCMEVEKSSKRIREGEMDEYTEELWDDVHRKIALACALELASPVYEFDTTKIVDPVARYKHFVEAHQAGELDPAFPCFSVWEMRQIVNCDAPNEQMSWCRRMVMNYAPHLTCLTDHKLRYIYLLHSDVRIRKPEWSSSPRTYPMVLSGGGNESVNSWFGRFMLKSFGLPSWGTKFRRKEGFTRWTPNGWEALNGADWDAGSWRGKTGRDFKMETEARNKAPPQEYFKRLVTLQCLADIIDGDPNSIPEGEKDVLHPNRMWRSMSIVSMDLLFQTDPEVVRTFDRTGEGLVWTNCEKYLEKYQNDAPDKEIKYNKARGELVIPASRHGYCNGGNVIVVDSFEGTKQLNFTSGGIVEYELPDNFPSKRYHLICEVCTVSSQQTPLFVQIGDDHDATPYEIKIPYTQGEWQCTVGIAVKVEGGSTIKISRQKGAMGLAIKQLVLK